MPTFVVVSASDTLRSEILKTWRATVYCRNDIFETVRIFANCVYSKSHKITI